MKYNKYFIVVNYSKLNIAHFSEKLAAIFVNKNYKDLFSWWKIVENNTKFKNIKKNLININSDYISKISKELR